MRTSVPWNTRDLELDALERGREALRRTERLATRPTNSPDPPPRRHFETSGSSDSSALLYPRRYQSEDTRNWGSEQRHPLLRGEARAPRTDSIDAVNRRLDELTRQLDHLAKINSVTSQRRSTASDDGLGRLAAAITRLDQRLEQMISEGRRAVGDIEQRLSAFDRTLNDWCGDEPWRASRGSLLGADPASGGEPGTPSMSRLPDGPHYTGASNGQQLSGLQKQMEQLTSRIGSEALHPGPDPARADTGRGGPCQPDVIQRRAGGLGNLDTARHQDAAAFLHCENPASVSAGRFGS
jgi:hypothetical protein